MTIYYTEKNSNGATFLFSEADRAQALEKLRAPSSHLSVKGNPGTYLGYALMSIKAMVKVGTIDEAIQALGAIPLQNETRSVHSQIEIQDNQGRWALFDQATVETVAPNHYRVNFDIHRLETGKFNLPAHTSHPCTAIIKVDGRLSNQVHVRSINQPPKDPTKRTYVIEILT